MALLKFFVVCVFSKSFLNETLECGCFSYATIAEFLEPSLRVILIYAPKKDAEGGKVLGVRHMLDISLVEATR